MIPILLALSVACLFQTVIYIIVVAIVISLVIWVIGYLGLPIPDMVSKLLVVLAVVICIYLLAMCLIGGHVPSNYVP